MYMKNIDSIEMSTYVLCCVIHFCKTLAYKLVRYRITIYDNAWSNKYAN